MFQPLKFYCIYNRIRDNNFLTSLQSGFIPGDSLSINLLSFTILFYQALDSGKEVRAVFCDISKAFDRVWHVELLYKLRAAGVSEEVMTWFQIYLSNIKQRVFLPGGTSDWVFILAGVPQGLS